MLNNGLRWMIALTMTISVRAQSLELLPAPGAQVSEGRPHIQVSWERGQIHPESCRLWVDGQEVTLTSLRSTDFLSFRPYRAGGAGPIRARFGAKSTTGQIVKRDWSFSVRPPTVIANLKWNDEGTLFEGDVLQVQFQAPPRGKAEFQIDHWAPVAMKEGPPGTYRGEYQVGPKDNGMSAPLRVRYENDTQRQELTASKPVQIFGGLYKVRITSPSDNSEVEQNFVIRGQARAGSRVMVIPNLGLAGMSAPSTVEGGGTLGSMPAEVDENGQFTLNYGLPIMIPGMSVAFTIYSIDPDGTRSAPTTVHYRFK